MTPLEVALDITPRARFDVIDVDSRVAEVHKDALSPYGRRLYMSGHTTAGYLPQSLAARLTARAEGVHPYLEIFRAMFPEGAGYQHDQLDLRAELPPEQRAVEPANADSHLAFMSSGLHACVTYDARRRGPAYFVDLDGTNRGVPRRRQTTIVGYNEEVEVARTTLRVPVSPHPIDAVNLKEPRLGLYEQLTEFIEGHDIAKGRVRLELAPGEHFASLTINEYETLLMRHDLAEVLSNPLRFATERARHAWNDPRAVPLKALGYAKYDFVRALNQLVDALGLQASRIEQLVARALAVPASRFLRMHRSVNLLVSDKRNPGRGTVVVGTYQAPILIQWRPAESDVREVNAVLTRFL